MHRTVTSASANQAAGPGDFPSAQRLRFFPLVCVMFFIVSGGPYGLEPAVSSMGPQWAILLVVLIPIVWSLPIALMVGELASSMPKQGGYYVWARDVLGDFWGVQQGWWKVSYTAVDLAIYPVLFVNYLAYFYPALAIDENQSASVEVMLTRWLIAVAVIVATLAINWRGAVSVGLSVAAGLALVLVPFAVLAAVGLAREGTVSTAFSLLAANPLDTFAAAGFTLGLSTVMWNYLGWDNSSTFAAEVHEPQRNYSTALLSTLAIVVAVYLLPLIIGIGITTDPAKWTESAGWPAIAREAGGDWLAGLLAGAGVAAAWSLFSSNLLYASRIPYAMARDGWLPSAMARVSKRTGVPVAALLTWSAITAVFAALPFGKLVVIDVILYALALALQFITLIVLRLQEPQMDRPFRVPGGWIGVGLATLAPLGCAGVLIAFMLAEAGEHPYQLMIVTGVIFGGPVLYLVRRRNAIQNESPAS